MYPDTEIITGPAPRRRLWVEVPRADAAPCAWGYSDRLSYRPGEEIALHVSATVPEVRIEMRRDPGHAGRAGWEFDAACATPFRPVPERGFESGFDWPESLRARIPLDAEPGGYLVTFRDPATGEALGHHFFVVRPAHPRAGALLLVLATSTWTAYNDFGGASHYLGVNDGEHRGRSPVLSTRRPWARGQVWLPIGAPRSINAVRPEAAEPPRFESVEWAYLNGYSKFYASSGWATFERHFVAWAEREGVTVDLATQQDLHDEPDLLGPYRCVSFVGHDEYWTARMRDAVDAYVDAGGRVARFAGNFMWQIRLEGDRQICFKQDAADRDPLHDTDPALVTGAWEDPRIGRPGASTFGLNAMRGHYAAYGGLAPRAARGFAVFRERHWALEGTGLGYGDLLGNRSAVFGYEVDGLEYTFRDGLPIPTGVDGAPDGAEIIAMNFSTAYEYGSGGPGDPGAAPFGDAEYRAAVLEGSTAPEAVKRHGRNAGMIVSFDRGAGSVFTVGGCEWVAGLLRRDHDVETVTRNVLRRFLTPPHPSERTSL